jgi:hypothetical protein
MSRYEEKEQDQYEESTLTAVRLSEKATHWEFCTDGAWLTVERVEGVEPRPGDSVRYYGRGFGYPVRGVDLNGIELYYETEQEYRDRVAAEQLAREVEEKAIADAERPERDARVAALPECFQKRIARFRRNNPDFYWEYEPYEMAACVDAVKIADTLRGDENLQDAFETFRKLPWSEQNRAVKTVTGEELDPGHSGDTFGMAMRLAHHYLTDERLVFADHAAIAPLVGCSCGCPPVTDAEMSEAGYAPFT